LFPSLDVLTGGDASVEASAKDASDTGAAGDALQEATAVDAGDAASDASPAGDAGTFSCAAHPSAIFCDPFDDAGVISNAWTTTVKQTATLAVTQKTPISPPNCVESAMSGTPTDTEARFYRHVNVTTNMKLDFGFAFRLDNWPSGGSYAAIAAIYPDATHMVAIVLDYSGTHSPQLFVNDQASSTSYSVYPLSAFPSGWFRIVYALVITGATSTIDILYDGASALGGPKTGPPITATDVNIIVGLTANGYAQTIRASYDDAYAEAK
jgi:hypothetical protein